MPYITAVVVVVVVALHLCIGADVFVYVHRQIDYSIS